MSIVLLFFILYITLLSVKYVPASRNLALLHPIFLQLLRSRTGDIVTSISVPDLVGDAMEVEIPTHMIEKVRKRAADSGDTKDLLWLSLLVCTSYEDIKSFKDEMVILMIEDMKSLGLYDESKDLTALCKYPIPAYTFFTIIDCLLQRNNPMLEDIRTNIAPYQIRKHLVDTGRFLTLRKHLKYFPVTLLGFLLASTLYLTSLSIPVPLVWFMLLIVILSIVLTLYAVKDVWSKKLPDCRGILSDIRASIPDLKMHF